LSDSDEKKFIAKMGAEALIEMLKRVELTSLSHELRHKAKNETLSKEKQELLKASTSCTLLRASVFLC
jgi:DNA-directed RNA polymerase subunit beta'